MGRGGVETHAGEKDGATAEGSVSGHVARHKSPDNVHVRAIAARANNRQG